jgi:spore coat polysaccharide biosynthesis protein SpsF (cytidylyltransferase family)
MNNDTGIIIQARTGSTRLPGKMTRNFHNSSCLFEVCLNNLKHYFNKENILVATTLNPNDDTLVDLCRRNSIEFFRGSEDNVLLRFINAAEFKGWKNIIRVCADNPFLMADKIHPLINIIQKSKADYAAYFFSDNTPSIRTHSGFFAEAVSLNALNLIARLTTEKIYLEHVTNYIYNNEDKFTLNKLNIEGESFIRKLRLTIDTEEDFKLAQSLFSYSCEHNKINYPKLFDYIKQNQAIMNKMSELISQQSK